MLMEVLKCVAALRHPGGKSTQHVFQEYALAIIFFPSFILVVTEIYRIPLGEELIFSGPATFFYGNLRFGILPRMEPKSHATNLATSLFFVLGSSPFCFLKLL
jgi:hypothetical protein